MQSDRQTMGVRAGKKTGVEAVVAPAKDFVAVLSGYGGTPIDYVVEVGPRPFLCERDIGYLPPVGGPGMSRDRLDQPIPK